MVNFEDESKIYKLDEIKKSSFDELTKEIYIKGEKTIGCYKNNEGFYMLFSNKRLMCIKEEGFFTVRHELSVFPYKNINTFYVKTSGKMNVDVRIDIIFKEHGTMRLLFRGRTKATELMRAFSEYSLMKDQTNND